MCYYLNVQFQGQRVKTATSLVKMVIKIPGFKTLEKVNRYKKTSFKPSPAT
jgi:hypothetical protein